ncbi:OmpP1/FadL family transporter [Marinobacter zhanjiangensis]|uniref:Aromatic hydrocarbon degradation protein n=1 Tax=Marinobacter zhanjiangensis TaxID=578215 RepID=A0ABQ3B9K3_9GAMM|nr:outer membrane protein transport protein [Marinobacter zhanjiangensis]GGY83860.1 aromatic hydrocarbon degradation protein [Marinobacter zhanjiangensis]
MHKIQKPFTRATRFVSVTVALIPTCAFAGGFSLNEQSASAMGNANAGAAANPENATTVLFNPAGMSQLSGTNLSFGAAVLDIDARAKGDSISVTREKPSVPVRSASDGGDIADPAILPNLYLTHEINDAIDVGFGIHAPYGLAADYDNDFAGRYFADKTELTAIAFTPAVSVSNGQGLSMGAAFNIIYAEGRLSRYQDLSGSAGAGALTLPEPYADIEGDDVAVTFRVGFLYELSDRTQFGLTAQTGTELELEGDAEISNVPVGPNFAQTTTLNEKVTVPLAIPETITVGARHRLTDDVTLLAGATYAKWSRFKELDIISRDSDGDLPGGPGTVITHITERWKNTWQFNLGGTWQATPAWALKAGYAWDESPVDDYVTARIPSEDRHWLTLGTQWRDAASGWTVDAAVGTLIFADDAEVDDREYSHSSPTVPSSQAGYQATYELSAWSASLQLSKAF